MRRSSSASDDGALSVFRFVKKRDEQKIEQKKRSAPWLARDAVETPCHSKKQQRHAGCVNVPSRQSQKIKKKNVL